MSEMEVKLVNTGAMPICCLAFLPRAVKVAREHGYALTVHGTLARDYDFVAVPWVENVAPPQELVNAMLRACGGFISPEDAGRLPIHKPHGRLCWPIHLGAGPYIDLSIMQPNARIQRRAQRVRWNELLGTANTPLNPHLACLRCAYTLHA